MTKGTPDSTSRSGALLRQETLQSFDLHVVAYPTTGRSSITGGSTYGSIIASQSAIYQRGGWNGSIVTSESAIYQRGGGGGKEVKKTKTTRFRETDLHLPIEFTCRVRLFCLHTSHLAPHVLPGGAPQDA